MKNKFISAEEAASMVKDGMTVMIGGFMAVGSPHSIIAKKWLSLELKTLL